MKTMMNKKMPETHKLLELIEKIDLDNFCNGNEWLEPFYAPHTFEVELIGLEDNEDSIFNVVEAIYEKEAAITKSKKKLKNSDVAVHGKEILRLAHKQKKGWFAIELANNLDDKFILPDYIDDALTFVNHSISYLLIKKIACYRLSKLGDENDDLIEENKIFRF